MLFNLSGNTGSKFMEKLRPRKVADALRTYQKYVQEYGTADDIPLDVYTENNYGYPATV